MVLVKFVLSVFSIVIAGDIVLRLFFHPQQRLPLAERFILALGIGTGFVGIETFFLSLTKVLLSLKYLLLFQGPLYLFFIIKFRKGFLKSYKAFPREKTPFSLLEIFFLMIIILEIIYVLLGAVSFSFNHWDAWDNWGFKAKIFFVDRTFPLELWTRFKMVSHVDYPLLFPFAESYIYFFLGQINEPFIKLFSSFFYGGIILLFYSHLKRQFSIGFVLGVCFCLATIPSLVLWGYSGYVDLPLTFYTCSGILYIWRYLKEGDNALLGLGCLLIGLGMWIKNEGFGFWFSLFLSCILICLKFKLNFNKRAFLFKVFACPLLIFSPWIYFKHIHGLKVAYFQRSWEGLPNLLKQRLPTILNISLTQSLNLSKWNILWVVFVFSLVWFLIRPRDRLAVFFLFIIVLQLVLYSTIYIIWPLSPQEIVANFLNSIDRLFIHLAPIALFFILLQLGHKWKIN